MIQNEKSPFSKPLQHRSRKEVFKIFKSINHIMRDY